MKVIRLDYTQVPDEKWEDVQFVTNLTMRIRAAQKHLSATGATKLTAVHETGHAIYWEKLGAAVNHTGPTLEYVGEIGIWRFYPMATTPSPSPTLLRANYKNLLGIAKGAAAGGEFVRRLLKDVKEEDVGDVDDRYRFARMCRILRDDADKLGRVVCFNEDKLWEKGQDAVARDLRDSENEATARRRVDLIIREWFE